MHDKMKCPKCKSELKIDSKNMEYYQSLVEHVMDPNGTRPLRPVFRCPKNCYGKKSFWNDAGEPYGYSSWFIPFLLWLYTHRIWTPYFLWENKSSQISYALDSISEQVDKEIKQRRND